MKKQYLKELPWRSKGPMDFRYNHVSGGWGRGSFRTFSERRRNAGDVIDHELVDNGFRIRGNRCDYNLNPWSNERGISKNWGRSWKHFTKFPKQWMKDERPVHPLKKNKLRNAIESLERDMGVLSPFDPGEYI